MTDTSSSTVAVARTDDVGVVPVVAAASPTPPTPPSNLTRALLLNNAAAPRTPSPLATTTATTATVAQMMKTQGSHHRSLYDAAGAGQEELLLDEAPRLDAPYSWERPLDTVNRHSRMLEAAPIAVGSPLMDTKRSSRIPSMLDPFGFNVGNEPSPYDTALAYSANPNTRSRASFLGPSSAPGAIGGGGHGYGSFPSTTSMQSYASSSGGTSPVPWQGTGGSSSPGSMELEGGVSRPWAKQRSASAGDSISSGGRQQFRGSLVRPGNPSKLSGEIGIEAPSPTRGDTLLPPPDLTKSKLYQRTLKAQKTLEKERAKAAAKGKVSKFDVPDDSRSILSSNNGGSRPSSRLGRRQSNASSFMSDMPLPGRRSRSSLGWFRSSSEATLPIPPSPSYTPPLQTSRSSSQLPLPGAHTRRSVAMPPPSPELPAEYQLDKKPSPPMQPQSQQRPSEERLKPSGDSSDRLKAYRESIGAAPPPRDPSPRRLPSRDTYRQNESLPAADTALPSTAPALASAFAQAPVLAPAAADSAPTSALPPPVASAMGTWSQAQRSSSGPIYSSTPLPGQGDVDRPPRSAPANKTSFDGANLPNHFIPGGSSPSQPPRRPTSHEQLSLARPRSTQSIATPVQPSTPVTDYHSAQSSPRHTLVEGQRHSRAPSPLAAPGSGLISGEATPREQPSQSRPPRMDSMYLDNATAPALAASDIRRVGTPVDSPVLDQEQPTQRDSSTSSDASPLEPITPRSNSMTNVGLGVLSGSGPSLPPAQRQPQLQGQQSGYPVYGSANGPGLGMPAGALDAEPRKRKSSLNLLLGSLMGGGGGGGGGDRKDKEQQAQAQAQAQAQRRTVSAGQQSQKPLPQPGQQRPAPTAAKAPKLSKGGFFSRNSKPSQAEVAVKQMVAASSTVPPQASSRTVPPSQNQQMQQSRSAPASPVKPPRVSNGPFPPPPPAAHRPLPAMPTSVYRKSNQPPSGPPPANLPFPPPPQASPYHHSTSAGRPAQQQPLQPSNESSRAATPTANGSINSSSQNVSRLSKSKPANGNSGGGGFSLFGRSRSKSLGSKAAAANAVPPSGARNGYAVDQFGNSRPPAPPQQLSSSARAPVPSSPLLSKGRPQQPAVAKPKTKKPSRWTSNANDGYHPAPPSAPSAD